MQCRRASTHTGDHRKERGARGWGEAGTRGCGYEHTRRLLRGRWTARWISTDGLSAAQYRPNSLVRGAGLPIDDYDPLHPDNSPSTAKRLTYLCVHDVKKRAVVGGRAKSPRAKRATEKWQPGAHALSTRAQIYDGWACKMRCSPSPHTSRSGAPCA